MLEEFSDTEVAKTPNIPIDTDLGALKSIHGSILFFGNNRFSEWSGPCGIFSWVCMVVDGSQESEVNGVQCL